MLKDVKNLSDDDIKGLKETIRNNPQLLDDPKLHDMLKDVGKFKQGGDFHDLPQETKDGLAQLAKDIIAKQKAPDPASGNPMTGDPRSPMPPEAPKSVDLPPPAPSPERLSPPPAASKSDWITHDITQGMAGLIKNIDRTPEGEALRTAALRELAKLESSSSSSSSGLADFLKSILSSDQAAWLAHAGKTTGAGFSGWDAGPAASAAPVFGASSDGLLDGVVWIAALALLVTAAWMAVAVARRQAAARRAARPWSPGPWPVRPSQVSTRRDLIRAFEHLAYLLLGQPARSLNHLDVADRLGGDDDGRAACRRPPGPSLRAGALRAAGRGDAPPRTDGRCAATSRPWRGPPHETPVCHGRFDRVCSLHLPHGRDGRGPGPAEDNPRPPPFCKAQRPFGASSSTPARTSTKTASRRSRPSAIWMIPDTPCSSSSATSVGSRKSPTGVENFVRRGGALFLATDRPLSLGRWSPPWAGLTGFAVSGESMACGDLDSCYRGLDWCPYLRRSRDADPNLFRNLVPSGAAVSTVATNAPSCLTVAPTGGACPCWRGCPSAAVPKGPGRWIRNEPLPFAVGGDVGKEGGRVLLLADHSIFINDMMIPTDNGNLDFSYNCLKWVTEGAGAGPAHPGPLHGGRPLQQPVRRAAEGRGRRAGRPHPGVGGRLRGGGRPEGGAGRREQGPGFESSCRSGWKRTASHPSRAAKPGGRAGRAGGSVRVLEGRLEGTLPARLAGAAAGDGAAPPGAGRDGRGAAAASR